MPNGTLMTLLFSLPFLVTSFVLSYWVTTSVLRHLDTYVFGRIDVGPATPLTPAPLHPVVSEQLNPSVKDIAPSATTPPGIDGIVSVVIVLHLKVPEVKSVQSGHSTNLTTVTKILTHSAE